MSVRDEGHHFGEGGQSEYAHQHKSFKKQLAALGAGHSIAIT